MSAKVIQLRSAVKTDALIPDGEYEAALVDYETGIYFFGHSPCISAMYDPCGLLPWAM